MTLWPRGFAGAPGRSRSCWWQRRSLAGSFFVLHERTGSELDVADRRPAGRRTCRSSRARPRRRSRNRRPAAPARSREFVNGQAYHPDSRIFAIEIGDGPEGRHQQRGADRGRARASRRAARPTSGSARQPDAACSRRPLGLRDARARAATQGPRAHRAGGDRRPPARHLPRRPVARRQVAAAQDSLRSTFLRRRRDRAAASCSSAAAWIATLVARPLDRIAAFAAERRHAAISTGASSRGDGPSEVRSLADVVQPHARPPAASLRARARVRRRRLARAAHPDHGRPGRARSAAPRRRPGRARAPRRGPARAAADGGR